MPNKDWTELDADKPTIEEWKVRRKTQTELADTQRPRRYKEAADLYTLVPLAQPLQAHEGLTKARSAHAALPLRESPGDGGPPGAQMLGPKARERETPA